MTQGNYTGMLAKHWQMAAEAEMYYTYIGKENTSYNSYIGVKKYNVL